MAVFNNLKQWRAERKDLLVEAEFAESMAEFEHLIGKYHQLNIRIYREEQAEAIPAMYHKPIMAEEYSIPTNYNNKVSIVN
jgi:hypothetical protein